VRRNEGWEGVEPEGYVPGEATKVIRHTLVGHRKENSEEPGPAIEVRYFEVPPGAVTRLEKHEHEHFVIASGTQLSTIRCEKFASTTSSTSRRCSRTSS
jgi:mannose-6-phosphate isomerase-like protein (cupin superfamily)